MGIKIFHEVAEFNGKKDMNFLGRASKNFLTTSENDEIFFRKERRTEIS